MDYFITIMQIIINFSKEQTYDVVYQLVKAIIEEGIHINIDNVLNYTDCNTDVDKIIYSILNNNEIKCNSDEYTFIITYSKVKQYLKKCIEEGSCFDYYLDYYLGLDILNKFLEAAEDESNNWIWFKVLRRY